MAVPSSGSLSLRSIATEIETNTYTLHPTSGFGLSQLGATSLRDMSQGPISATNSTGSLINSGENNDGFQVLNVSNPSSNRPNGNTPHAMSEFYGYDHDLVATSTPTISTSNPSSITSSGMRLNGNMSSNGGATVTAKGFVYSTGLITNPLLGGMGVTNITVSSPNTTGSYNRTVSGLSASTTYYIKAYATNSQGTSYGVVRSATTSSSWNTRYITGPHQKAVFACGNSLNQTVKYQGTFGNGSTLYDSNTNLMNSTNGGNKWYGGPPNSGSGVATSSTYFYVNGSGVVSNYSLESC